LFFSNVLLVGALAPTMLNIIGADAPKNNIIANQNFGNKTLAFLS